MAVVGGLPGPDALEPGHERVVDRAVGRRGRHRRVPAGSDERLDGLQPELPPRAVGGGHLPRTGRGVDRPARFGRFTGVQTADPAA